MRKFGRIQSLTPLQTAQVCICLNPPRLSLACIWEYETGSVLFLLFEISIQQNAMVHHNHVRVNLSITSDSHSLWICNMWFHMEAFFPLNPPSALEFPIKLHTFPYRFWLLRPPICLWISNEPPWDGYGYFLNHIFLWVLIGLTISRHFLDQSKANQLWLVYRCFLHLIMLTSYTY